MEKQRSIINELTEYMDIFPIVGIVGPRQVGKTTLVKNFSKSNDYIYLDLEKASDQAKLNDIELFLKPYQDKLVVLDEVQMMPSVFQELRPLIDEHRKNGRFILLGSASPELIRKSADSLAGRIGYLELSPFHLKEVDDQNKLWLRGGFPLSYLAKSNKASLIWRSNFIQSYLERDLAILGLNTDFKLVERFLLMLANAQGGIWNADSFARSLGITRPTVNKYLQFLEAAFLLRVIEPYHVNIKKRLVKSPKVFIRDTGLLHALLDIETTEDLNHQLIIGASWESFVMEQIINIYAKKFQYYYYRTHQGAECDLLLVKKGKVEYAIEIKHTLKPKISKGFTISIQDTKAKRGIIICRVENGYDLSENVQALNLHEFITLIE